MHDIYFAASNSGAGFVSYYDQLFTTDKFARIYLIKGGPGTGKSSLLRQMAAEAKRRGLPVRQYACSSDPDSLDAIAVGRYFAMLDATAPHFLDTVLPGAADELIDLGQFWNADLLRRARAEIADFNRQKKEAYARAYQWLAGIQACRRITVELLMECVDYPKLCRAVERCLDGLTVGGGRSTPALIDSIGMQGRICTDSMHTASERALILSGTRGGGTVFLQRVAEQAKILHLDTEVAWSPIESTHLSGVSFPRDGLAILDENCAGELRPFDRRINMARFWKTDRLRKVRTELRHAAHCEAAMSDGASLAFAEVKAAHFALEQIYSAAMDFAALNRYREGLVARIFSAIGD